MIRYTIDDQDFRRDVLWNARAVACRFLADHREVAKPTAAHTVDAKVYLGDMSGVVVLIMTEIGGWGAGVTKTRTVMSWPVYREGT